MKKIIVLLTLISFFVIENSSAQGVFEKQNSASSDTEIAMDSKSPEGLFRDKGTGGTEEPNVPIGEGLLILTVLAGGYSLVKNRKDKK